MRRRLNQAPGYQPTYSRAHRPSPLTVIASCKCLIHVERYLIAQDVVTRPRQFVRYRLDRHNPIGPRTLALVVALDLGVETDGKIGGLDERPGQIAIAILGVAPALRLPLLIFSLPTQRQ